MAKIIKSTKVHVIETIKDELKKLSLDYKVGSEPLNQSIDTAISTYASKNSSVENNRPDAKLLLRDTVTQEIYPIIISCKGREDRLIKLDASGFVQNTNSKRETHFGNINSYAVNGAVYYANSILHYTEYTAVIAIGIAGHMDVSGNFKHQISAYLVATNNLGAGVKIDDYKDLSFLSAKNVSNLVHKLNELTLTSVQLEKLHEQKDSEIDASLRKFNNDIYEQEEGLTERDRVCLAVASILATIGTEDTIPLFKETLRSLPQKDMRDGDILMQAVDSFLATKNLPNNKKDLIIRTLSNTVLSDNVNMVTDGETQVKRVFCKVIDELGIHYKIGLTADFTGKLFNEMYSWLGFTQDKFNDVVLTPPYVATLLAKLARADKDSYVWDITAGSAGLLIAAMNEMLDDAENKNTGASENLTAKKAHIKTNQLLGVELSPSIYMLATLNMILASGECFNILNKNSLTEFDGACRCDIKSEILFPATSLVLNPPYSAAGNGMIFAEKALNMMNRGYGAILIQSSAGTGKAAEYNKRILEKHTLLASIKMPTDLFTGKSTVQTHIYVLRVGEQHYADDIVKFIDFSNDGYTRTNRKKASTNLRDTDQAKERYQEVADLARWGKPKLTIFTEKEYYEGHIDPCNGADWNQSAPTDITPTLDDFKKTVSDYLSWEVSSLLKNQNESFNNLKK